VCSKKLCALRSLGAFARKLMEGVKFSFGYPFQFCTYQRERFLNRTFESSKSCQWLLVLIAKARRRNDAKDVKNVFFLTLMG
jgi:hypothetical protein